MKTCIDKYTLIMIPFMCSCKTKSTSTQAFSKPVDSKTIEKEIPPPLVKL